MEEKKTLTESLVKSIKESIREQTLSGEFWGKMGALSKEKICLMHSRNLGGTFLMSNFSSASGTYYAASGNAVSRAKRSNLFSKLLWYWRAWKCLRKSEKFSDKFAALKEMKYMSCGELDTRACVLHKTKRRKEALSYLSYGIMKISTKQMGAKHDLCLFLIYEAEILAEMGKRDQARRSYVQATKLSRVGTTIPKLTRIRVFKSYGGFLAAEGRNEDTEDIIRRSLDYCQGKQSG